MQSTNSEYGSPYLATCHFTSLHFTSLSKGTSTLCSKCNGERPHDLVFRNLTTKNSNPIGQRQSNGATRKYKGAPTEALIRTEREMLYRVMFGVTAGSEDDLVTVIVTVGWIIDQTLMCFSPV
ncbi:hypothetical protein DPX16_5405 [Anabarilius grahami]|uniref:Uncharacterized protein n=1 Tax=Anabarilius grahami TaxID=495550 RepID=A0A3N0YH19_ANAGA|nr:hypothetical protein DPX16_5405 [Anabarilius grahami]